MLNINLTEKTLKQLNTCNEGIAFAKRNKLIGFPLNRLTEIEGDYNGFVEWIKNENGIIDLDERGNLIHLIKANGYERWQEYDERDNITHIKALLKFGEFEKWQEFDENDNIILIKYLDGCNEHFEYDKNNNCVFAYDSKGNKFWKKYDENNNLIYHKRSDGFEKWYEYDKHGNLVHYRDSNKGNYMQSFDENGNVTLHEKTNGKVVYKTIHYDIEYYSNGQLKKMNDLKIPYFKK